MYNGDMAHAYIFYGSPGAGKGTQAKRLCDYFTAQGKKVETVANGTWLRDFAKRDTPSAKRVQQVLTSGGLVPAFIPIYIWTEKLLQTFVPEKIFIFDGIARRIEEVDPFVDALLFLGFKSISVTLLAIPDDEAVHRLLKRGRIDDTENVVRQRLTLFNTTTREAMEKLAQRKEVLFHEVDGTGTLDDITSRLFDVLKLKQ